MKYFIFSILFFTSSANAASCGPIVSNIIRSAPIVDQMAPGALVQANECVSAQIGADHYLLNIVVLDDRKSGMQSRLLIFNEKGLSVNSRPIFLSGSLGLDSFPIMTDGKERMIVFLATSGSTIRFLLNTQSGPHANQFGEWTFDFDKRSLKANSDRQWTIESTRFPRLSKTANGWQVQIEGKTIDLNNHFSASLK